MALSCTLKKSFHSIHVAGTTLAAMYASEFAAHGNDAMFRERIQAGLIKVNGAGMRCSWRERQW